MAAELNILLATAATIACLHTLAGPDHYIPFIALSKSRSWTLQKTLLWTTLCGTGHVLSSVLLGLIGAAIGYSMNWIGWIESFRGDIAGWMIIGFGVVYTLYGLYFMRKNRLHKHFETTGEQVFVFEHRDNETMVPHERHPVTPWVMFLIFVLGPCEPMIPLLFYPAAQDDPINMGILVLIYTLITLLVMTAMVLLGYFGIDLIRINNLEKKLPVLSGLAILICGIGMVFMGW